MDALSDLHNTDISIMISLIIDFSKYSCEPSSF